MRGSVPVRFGTGSGSELVRWLRGGPAAGDGGRGWRVPKFVLQEGGPRAACLERCGCRRRARGSRPGTGRRSRCSTARTRAWKRRRRPVWRAAARRCRWRTSWFGRRGFRPAVAPAGPGELPPTFARRSGSGVRGSLRCGLRPRSGSGLAAKFMASGGLLSREGRGGVVGAGAEGGEPRARIRGTVPRGLRAATGRRSAAVEPRLTVRCGSRGARCCGAVTRTLTRRRLPFGARTRRGPLFERRWSRAAAWAEMARRRDVVGLLREFGSGAVLARPVDLLGPGLAARPGWWGVRAIVEVDVGAPGADGARGLGVGRRRRGNSRRGSWTGLRAVGVSALRGGRCRCLSVCARRRRRRVGAIRCER